MGARQRTAPYFVKDDTSLVVYVRAYPQQEVFLPRVCVWETIPPTPLK